MANSKKQILNISENNIPTPVLDSCNKKVNEYNNFIQNSKISPQKKIQEKQHRFHLSPQSSCGSSTGSAFSSYCTSSCNSSTCFRRNCRPTSSRNSSSIGSRNSSSIGSRNSSSIGSRNSSSIGSTISSSGSSSVLSCESSDCNHSSNTYLSTNIGSSYTSLSNSSSISSGLSGSDDPPEEFIENKSNSESDNSINKKRFTRSSLSSSGKNGSIQLSNNDSFSSNNSESFNNSNNTTKTSSTIVTTKVTRSTTLNSLKSLEPENKIVIKEDIKVSDIDGIEKKQCMWNKCSYIGNSTDVDNSLIDHIKSKHIYSQKNSKRFRCLWKGCSVYQKPAYHFNWLERHVVDHIEKRPYMCIFNGCKRKFRTEEAREKHCQFHINTPDTIQLQSTSNQSPTKTRSHLLLNNAKLALIQNIKNKNNPVSPSKSVKPLTNYSQILKNLNKKRKTQMLTAKKFKKAQFKDFLDDFSIKVLDNKLKSLNYETGTCTFSAEIIGSRINKITNTEMFLIQWNPKNILEDEWVEKYSLCATKELRIKDLPKKANSLNPFYRSHRFRADRRK